MKYVSRQSWIELHPEDQSDIDHLIRIYGARMPFAYWCIANTPPPEPPWESWQWTYWLRKVDKKKELEGQS